MGSSLDSSTAPSAAFLAVFRAHADASGTMSFARFMALALYDTAVGYYRQRRPRVGYERGTDFFTASTSGPIFGELIDAAAFALLQAAGRDPQRHAFVEIGPETAGGVMTGVAHRFARVELRRPDEPLDLTGDCVVFSNELFDAQPCTRTVRRGNVWHELGVRLEGDRLVEVEIPSSFAAPEAPDGYQLDRPLAAADLAAKIAAEPWQGLFLAFDYGRTWAELAHALPAGTARAYFRHTQSNDLLARPGEQDLTCHICWDWIAEALKKQGFNVSGLLSQESFLVRHAATLLQEITEAEATRLSRRKLALMQLLHPSHLGQKFQVLHAVR
jgi:SAM-dependent MidA family methyltransferase